MQHPFLSRNFENAHIPPNNDVVPAAGAAPNAGAAVDEALAIGEEHRDWLMRI
jgi:hypothetical protein